ncbi:MULTISPECIES: DUF3991 and TOPRIM domain-containing protein [Rhizobium]|uniref:DUF3991 domain-containing protein n=1 Tax=Rhizobium hidalgonense TaxID=1538159 RepID=A0ABX4JPJ6_9HYPH|nr:DUF3991 and TOPRIM domain-containing protein [Rhizobium hidalgonense]PDT21845.1 hypothetical protein CO674_20090 [Rhizobium hidalgonense]PON08504.1 hypothetical protein ATY29_05790 [Rhizobium hidalgonense]UWU39059.1 DUF3991 and toprim domain-containing protein [Rhizobium leguminosarum bv. phaseoli]
MDRQKIEELRERVSCGAVLVDAGFALDARESSRRAVKFRRGGEIVIVTHGGAGWFDPLSDEKGDVFSLAVFLEKIPFKASIARVRRLAGVNLMPAPRWLGAPPALLSVEDTWERRPRLFRLSPAWRYLHDTRALPWQVLRRVAEMGIVRQGPQGSAWFAHHDEAGTISGWEERGPQWRGFSTGGSKTLFRLGGKAMTRVCITEAAIDALSLAALEDIRPDTLYASTGGGWSPSTVRAIETIAPKAMLVAATDADPQGEVYADRLRQIADRVGGDFIRLRPHAIDWNEELKERQHEEDVPHTRAAGSRVKLRPPDGGP